MNAAERFLTGELKIAVAPYKGELSEWIYDAATNQVDPALFVSHGVMASPERQLLEVSGSVIANPKSESELGVVKKLLDNLEPADWRAFIDAANSGDSATLTKLQSEIQQKVAPALKGITQMEAYGMMNQLSRFRAQRAMLLCMVLFKSPPLSLINRAKSGDRTAALDLIKIDKLFTTDSCVRDILRDAALSADKSFLNQVGRAVRTYPRVSSQKICRLYLYFLWSMGIELPSVVRLQLLLDPNGTSFNSAGAFAKYLERCKADFQKLTATASHQDPKSEGSPARPPAL